MKPPRSSAEARREKARNDPARSRAASPEDIALFRDALQDVRPLATDIVPSVRPAPPALPIQSRRDARAVLDEMVLRDPSEFELETGDELLFKRTGVQTTVMRKLRRGQYTVQAELDLHGLTAANAKTQLVQFLHTCKLRGVRCVRIIHGKGLGSPGRLPVLKPKVAYWLAQRDEVMAYVSARAVDGGTGAVYVLLKLSA